MSVSRRIAAAIVLATAISSGAQAQTMRFETSVGAFDMELNPGNDPNLQPLVDNIVAYIGLGRYHYTAINRAADSGPGTADDFVLQMGSFLGFPPTPSDYLGLIQEIKRLNPVITDANGDGQVDFSAISNQRGTVSLALSAGGPNTGTSSFFINLRDNSGLDSQGFVPFARVVDMTTVDRIMALQQTNLTGDPNDLTFSDVPLLENGRLVILKSVRVLQAAPSFSFTGPIAAALAAAPDNGGDEAAQAALLSSDPQDGSDLLSEVGDGDLGLPELGALPPVGGSNAVPEPAAAVLAASALLAAGRLRRRVA